MDAAWAWMGNPAAALDLMARATALLGLVMLITWGFRSRGAWAQHSVWTTGFVLLATLPIAMHWLPTLELTILPSLPSAPSVAAAEPIRWVAAAAAVPAAPTPEVVGTASGPHLLMLLWALGSAVSLLSLCVGWARFVAWARGGRAIHDGEWIQSVEGLRRRLRIRRKVRLIESPKVHMPMVGGLFRPVVLLPEQARAWSEDRRQAVLIHELIHVRRHDVLRQLLGGVALALYWFHPLIWLAARRAAMSREQACDEGVLQLGARPSAYARHLLELATAAPPPWLKNVSPVALVLPLVQRSQLERRVMGILAPRRQASSLLLAAALCTLMIVCGVATAVSQPISAADAFAKSCPSPNPVPD